VGDWRSSAVDVDFGPIDRFEQWLFVAGDRRVVTASLLAFVYLALVGLWLVNPVEMQSLITETNTVQQLLNTLLGGAILLISIVVSINSLVVSQELTPIGSQHERVVESWEFREQAAEAVGSAVSPAAPGKFLVTILDAVERELDALESAGPDLDAESREAVDEFTADVRQGMEATRDVLSGDDATVSVTLFGPAYDPAEYIDAARTIRVEHEEAFTGQAQEALTEIIAALQYFATAREYFKTVYYKREFSNLSRDLLYAGLPAILVISYVLLALDAEALAGTLLGISRLYLFFSIAYVIALAPFLVLTAYVLRAAIIAEHTVTAGAFIIE
jgi:hypothetical protein